MTEQTKEFRLRIADAFIKALESDPINWSKRWQGISAMPVNATTGKKYKGINRFWLSLRALELETEDPRWCTFKQIQDKGWKLQKGAKGEKVEYWMPYDFKAKKPLSWAAFRALNNTEDVGLVAKYYTVFNATKIEGIPMLELPETQDVHADELLALISQHMHVPLTNDGGDRAYYSILEDAIHLPKAEYFQNDYAYNSTALHELAHATGAPQRLNRSLGSGFGSPTYAFEELVAEISACFMSAYLPIQHDETHLENHKAYVQSWISDVKEKPETLIKAIREAESASNYMEFHAGFISETEYTATRSTSMQVPAEQIMAESVNAYRQINEGRSNAMERMGQEQAAIPKMMQDIWERTQRTINGSSMDGERMTELLRIQLRLPERSLLEAAAIYAQFPYARHLKSAQDWKEWGCAITCQRGKSIKVITPIEVACFYDKGGEERQVQTASLEERMQMVSGELSTHPKTVYQMQMVYDISQTNCPEAQYANVLARPYDVADHRALYDCVQDYVKQCGFRVEVSMHPQVTAETGIYAGQGEIMVSMRAHESQQLVGLCNAFAQGLVAESALPDTSRMERVLEAEILSASMKAQIGIPIDDTSLHVIGQKCNHAITSGVEVDTMLRRVHKMQRHVQNGLGKTLAAHADTLMPGMQQTAKKEMLTDRQRDIKANFMQDIE